MGIRHSGAGLGGVTFALIVVILGLALGPPGVLWRLPLGALGALLALELRRRREPAPVSPRPAAAAAGRPLSLLSTGLYDPLTRLPNRTLLNELLEKQVAQANRSGYRMGVVVFDVDRFRSLNDSLGQTAGDRLLRHLGDRFQAQIRQSDTLARTGGDGFTLLVAKAERPEDVELAMRRILSTLDDPFSMVGQEVLVSASAGASVYPDDTLEPALLLSFAEEALARVKAQGGNGHARYGPSMSRGTRERALLEQELRHAIGGRELVVHYQPQVSLTDGAIVGMEGLVRWRHPEHGLLPAGRFIPLAEGSGLMGPLGEWLLEEVCRQGSVWWRGGLAAVPISVNVSIRQFQSGDVAATLTRALEKSGLDPTLLQIEITESIAMHDSERIGEGLTRIQELGVKIHLDDFGTGYSSLSYLLRYPVDVIKIDRSFIHGVPEAEHGAKIVRSTIALAQSLGLDVIAEGVETAEQLSFLRRHGCPAAQGYLFARPIAAAEMKKLLARGRVDLDSLHGTAVA